MIGEVVEIPREDDESMSEGDAESQDAADSNSGDEHAPAPAHLARGRYFRDRHIGLCVTIALAFLVSDLISHICRVHVARAPLVCKTMVFGTIDHAWTAALPAILFICLCFILSSAFRLYRTWRILLSQSFGVEWDGRT